MAKVYDQEAEDEVRYEAVANLALNLVLTLFHDTLGAEEAIFAAESLSKKLAEFAQELTILLLTEAAKQMASNGSAAEANPQQPPKVHGVPTASAGYL